MMKTNKRLLIISSLAIILILGVQTSVFAVVPYICDSYVEGQTIDSDILVPPGETCEINNSTINGNVIVQKGASFLTDFSLAVYGDFNSNRASEISLGNVELYGDLTIGNGNQVSIYDGTNVHGSTVIHGNNSVGASEWSSEEDSVIANNVYVNLWVATFNHNLVIIQNESLDGWADPDGTVNVGGNAICVKNGDYGDIAFSVIGKNKDCPVLD